MGLEKVNPCNLRTGRYFNLRNLCLLFFYPNPADSIDYNSNLWAAMGSKRKRSENEMGDWANLPTDILFVLIKRFEYMEDFISFTAVCKSWNFTTQLPALPPRSPMIMRGEKLVSIPNGIHEFYSLSTRKIHDFDLPEASRTRCLGTSHGWFFTAELFLEISTDDVMLNNVTTKSNLLHPFSRRQISMPPLFAFKDQSNYTAPRNKLHLNNCAVKLAMSRNPLQYDHDEDCVVLVTAPDYDFLAFARLGDQVWTPIPPCSNRFKKYDDVVCYKGVFYAVSPCGALFICNVSSDVEIAPKPITAPVQPSLMAQKYLVESLGDLLLVFRIRLPRHKRNPWRCPKVRDTLGFFVYKLIEQHEDTEGYTYAWKEVENLGGRALFVGGNATVSLCSSKLVNADCIYFSDDNKNIPRYASWESAEDTGVYYMTNKSFKSHFPWYMHLNWYF